MIAPVKTKQEGSKVRLADWVLKRMNIPKNHPIAKARGVIRKMDGGPFGSDWADIKFSGKLLKARYTRLDHVELV